MICIRTEQYVQYKNRSGKTEGLFVLQKQLPLKRVVDEYAKTAEIKADLVKKRSLQQAEMLHFYFLVSLTHASAS